MFLSMLSLILWSSVFTCFFKAAFAGLQTTGYKQLFISKLMFKFNSEDFQE